MISSTGDLIFKELIKRGYKTSGGKRVWSLADSKLWYLTKSQAQKYLDLEGDKEYNKDIIDKETSLIGKHFNDISNSLTQGKYNLVDLGCGNGKKAALLLKNLHSKLDIRYCPIDISSYMVKQASETINELRLGEVVKFKWNVSDFENLNNITPLLRDTKYPHNLILLLGNTLGNFDIEDMLRGVKLSMEPQDVLLIGNGVSGNKKPEEWVKTYRNATVREWLMETLSLIGLSDDDVEYDVRFVGSKIEEIGVLKHPKKVKYLWHSIEFEEGDIITVLQSYKYSLNQFEKAISNLFPASDLCVDEQKSYVLAICTM